MIELNSTYGDLGGDPMVALKKADPAKYKSRLIFPGVKKLAAGDIKKLVDSLKKAADQKQTAKKRESA
ncbi:MAG: hypothetical protein ACYC5H_04315 [Methylovirgula sp.]